MCSRVAPPRLFFSCSSSTTFALISFFVSHVRVRECACVCVCVKVVIRCPPSSLLLPSRRPSSRSVGYEQAHIIHKKGRASEPTAWWWGRRGHWVTHSDAGRGKRGAFVILLPHDFMEVSVPLDGISFQRARQRVAARACGQPRRVSVRRRLCFSIMLSHGPSPFPSPAAADPRIEVVRVHVNLYVCA